MEKMINIPRTITDDFYRYQMPELSLVYEAGLRTIIANLQRIAKSLNCLPIHIFKYIALQLGTHHTFKDGKYILNGVHTLHQLNKYLDKFIDKYTLCHTCSLPEITLSKTLSKIKKTCNACGNREFIQVYGKFDDFLFNNV